MPVICFWEIKNERISQKSCKAPFLGGIALIKLIVKINKYVLVYMYCYFS